MSSLSPDNNWHLDKKVPLSIILVLLVYGISGLWFIADVKKDVEVLKVQMAVQEKRDTKQDSDWGGTIALIREDLTEIKRNLIRALEANSSNGKK